uniref:Uncharacterized protein n=1 Tax=Romanomermis culicivorax TaxID=13658 RepID=A0A915JGP3_ROMCU
MFRGLFAHIFLFVIILRHSFCTIFVESSIQRCDELDGAPYCRPSLWSTNSLNVIFGRLHHDSNGSKRKIKESNDLVDQVSNFIKEYLIPSRNVLSLDVSIGDANTLVQKRSVTTDNRNHSSLNRMAKLLYIIRKESWPNKTDMLNGIIATEFNDTCSNDQECQEEIDLWESRGAFVFLAALSPPRTNQTNFNSKYRKQFFYDPTVDYLRSFALRVASCICYHVDPRNGLIDLSRAIHQGDNVSVQYFASNGNLQSMSVKLDQGDSYLSEDFYAIMQSTTRSGNNWKLKKNKVPNYQNNTDLEKDKNSTHQKFFNKNATSTTLNLIIMDSRKTFPITATSPTASKSSTFSTTLTSSINLSTATTPSTVSSTTMTSSTHSSTTMTSPTDISVTMTSSKDSSTSMTSSTPTITTSGFSTTMTSSTFWPASNTSSKISTNGNNNSVVNFDYNYDNDKNESSGNGNDFSTADDGEKGKKSPPSTTLVHFDKNFSNFFAGDFFTIPEQEMPGNFGRKTSPAEKNRGGIGRPEGLAGGGDDSEDDDVLPAAWSLQLLIGFLTILMISLMIFFIVVYADNSRKYKL